MPNLVGIGNSQVPTNAMLGGLAYQDSVGEINIDKIKARTGDTAVDIFVYDTRKDSDGGAWRHRTQKTSWYNEAVSATRGARKEFPAVAVIVAETDTLTIYDGDDSNLSMWMVFEANTDSQDLFINDSSSSLTSVAALNGRVFVGSVRTSTTGNITGIDFIGDRGGMVYTSSSDIRTYAGGVGHRNDGLGNFASTSNWFTLGNIVNRNVNDVAMTVLPNAPIDDTTGLPVPTIALATDGGFSVIKDNRIVIDKGVTSTATNEVDWYKGQYLLGTGPEYWALYKDLSAETSGYISGTADLYSAGNQSSWDKPQPTGQESQVIAVGDLIVGGSTAAYNNHQPGLSLKHPTSNLSNGSSNLLCEIRKNYNTGWQHGDIKGTFMSDIDTTNLTDTQAVTNPGPFTSTTGWAAANVGWSVSDSNNRLVINSGSQTSSYFGAAQTLNLVTGTKYVLVVNIHSQTKTAVIRLTADGNYFTTTGLGTGEHAFYFKANQASHSIFIGSDVGGSNREQQISSVTIREVEEDRSINDKGLQVFGTVTKTPVATGAELVAYSNFSNSNYLLQPYNSDLNFTDTMSIMLWVNGWVGSDSLLHRGPGTDRNEKTSFHLYCSYDYNYRLTLCSTALNADGNTVEQTFEIPLSGNLTGWQHLCFTLSNGNVRGFLNGVEKTLSSNSFTGTNIFSQATHQNGLYIGTGPVGGPAATASLALLRLSATTPSADQIKKIYDDEKCLFQKNAKCTLYGTAANAVTALAYDDSNNVVHVGTSSGRSEFQGLNRINNTTTAVTTAISVSNELVAEQ